MVLQSLSRTERKQGVEGENFRAEKDHYEQAMNNVFDELLVRHIIRVTRHAYKDINFKSVYEVYRITNRVGHVCVTQYGYHTVVFTTDTVLGQCMQFAYIARLCRVVFKKPFLALLCDHFMVSLQLLREAVETVNPLITIWQNTSSFIHGPIYPL